MGIRTTSNLRDKHDGDPSPESPLAEADDLEAISYKECKMLMKAVAQSYIGPSPFKSIDLDPQALTFQQ